MIRRLVASMGALVLMTSGAFAQCNGSAVELQCTISSWSLDGSGPSVTARADCQETNTGAGGPVEITIRDGLIPAMASIQGDPSSFGQVTICFD